MPVRRGLRTEIDRLPQREIAPDHSGLGCHLIEPRKVGKRGVAAHELSAGFGHDLPPARLDRGVRGGIEAAAREKHAMLLDRLSQPRLYPLQRRLSGGRHDHQQRRDEPAHPQSSKPDRERRTATTRSLSGFDPLSGTSGFVASVGLLDGRHGLTAAEDVVTAASHAPIGVIGQKPHRALRQLHGLPFVALRDGEDVASEHAGERVDDAHAQVVVFDALVHEIGHAAEKRAAQISFELRRDTLDFASRRLIEHALPELCDGMVRGVAMGHGHFPSVMRSPIGDIGTCSVSVLICGQAEP